MAEGFEGKVALILDVSDGRSCRVQTLLDNAREKVVSLLTSDWLINEEDATTSRASH